ncbi:MAG: hypothetical protein KKA73_03030 [Chloroflexi bacterium]|nr:hypothetical protein [Chloroflexota bacterium]MBU1746638.1 hypothetical protein [Chloroflexota bacterium]
MELGFVFAVIVIIAVIVFVAIIVMTVLMGLAAGAVLLAWLGGVAAIVTFWVRLLRQVRRGQVDPEERGFTPLRAMLAGVWGLDVATPAGALDERVVRVPVPDGA